MAESYLDKEWETRTCGEGERCWCRSIWVKGGLEDHDCIIGTAQINKEEADHIVAAHNEYLVETVRNAERQVWYCNALDVLSPLRFHLHEIMLDIECQASYNRIMGTPFRIAGLEAAKAALEAAEAFCTGKNNAGS